MLKRVVITNYLGESMEYKIDGAQANNPSGLIITSIDGLGPVKANINMTDLTAKDGQLFNSARLSGRNIVIKGIFTHATSIEEARYLSYKYFPIKKKVTIRVETDTRTAETTGYVESNEPDIFSEQSGCQISILCEDAYFDGGKVGYTFSDTIPLFKFAFGNESTSEPLIKLSENATVEDVRELVYEGDADTGMEIDIDVKTSEEGDPLVDSLSVTGEITISGDNNTQMKLDLSKMQGIAPNTSVTNLPRGECSFILNESKCKFFKVLPDECLQTYTFPVVFQNELHVFSKNNNTARNRFWHLKWDSDQNEWVHLSEETIGRDVQWIVNLNDTLLYAYDNMANKILNRANNSTVWNEVSVNPPFSTNTYNLACVVGNYIHCFNSNGFSSGTFTCTHYIYDGNRTITQVDDMQLFNDGNHKFMDSKIVSSGNDIYILGAGDSYPRAMYHYNDDSKLWEESSVLLPALISDIAGACFYKNKIYIVAGFSANGDVCSFNPSVDTSWSVLYQTPYAGILTAFGNYMYIIGGNSNYTYSEEANDNKLVENDKLVINTIKGKKSIYLYRGTTTTNVLNILGKDSTWFQLQRGVNRFSYDATTGAENMKITMIANKLYEGM